MENIELLYIDLFCGAGGTSSGVEYATVDGRKCAKVIACVNHDANAIKSHAANHPKTMHFTEDIRTLDLAPLVRHLQKMKLRYPQAKVVLWASLECTNFSKAKGGKPRDADSRTLAEHLFRYIEAISPDYIQIENVEEFMCWGDLDENGHPISRFEGRSYMRWVKHVKDYGYDYDWRLLNAADFGAYTSRKRFFGQFAKKGLPIAFPYQTYAKNGDDGGMFQMYQPWKPVREVLDLDDEGESIFVKKKPLCEKTLERIYAGLIKSWQAVRRTVKWNSMKDGRYRAPSVDEPCPTLPCRNTIGVCKAQFLSKQFSGDPMSKNQDIDRPAGTVTCKDHHAFVTAYYGNGFNQSVDEPAPMVTTKDRIALVTTQFLDNQYGKSKPTSIESPAPMLLNNPKQKMVSAQYLTEYYGGKDHNHSINVPCTTLTTRVRHYLMNPLFASAGGSIDNPCFTLIARMDKMPPYLVSTEQGVGIAIYDDDTPMTRKVKEFMAMYGIIDIKMRMLKIVELKRIMGFPDDYTLIGTQAEQKKFIGNAVEVNMSRVLCEALARKLMDKAV